MSANNVSVSHEPENSRFIVEVDGVLAGFADYVQQGDVRNFNHTEVFPQFQGNGLSKPLIKAGLDDSRANGFGVRPSCPAVAQFIIKNPEYADLKR